MLEMGRDAPEKLSQLLSNNRIDQGLSLVSVSFARRFEIYNRNDSIERALLGEVECNHLP
jgi:hypothetical protein